MMLNDGWVVTIECVNKNNKIDRLCFMEYGSIYDCTRLIHTFRPKRGYEIYKFDIEKVTTLV